MRVVIHDGCTFIREIIHEGALSQGCSFMWVPLMWVPLMRVRVIHPGIHSASSEKGQRHLVLALIIHLCITKLHLAKSTKR